MTKLESWIENAKDVARTKCLIEAIAVIEKLKEALEQYDHGDDTPVARDALAIDPEEL
jgi:hypothetical protein